MASEIQEVAANGMRFTCRMAGPAAGEPVLLLHGFPETSFMWEPLMAVLASEGYRCAAPDQRGYSPGARPEGVEAYSYRELAGDVAALASAFDWPRYHLVGHDWGALAGWAVLACDAGPVASWTAMSVPHYGAFAEAVYDDPEEETYRGLLDLFLTDAAEEALGGSDMAGLRAAWAAVGGDEQVDAYAGVFGQPGALTAALNWYRAARAHRRALDDPSLVFGPVSTPTLLLWGRDDPYVRRRSVDLAAARMTGPYRVVELHAGHWLAQERPGEVKAELLAHLRANRLASS